MSHRGTPRHLWRGEGGEVMPRIIKSGLIQMSLPKTEGEGTVQEIKDAMVQKHIPFIEEAGKKGATNLDYFR